jgi:[acyl-carrier-protein] S-malonyltransferase
VGMGRELARTYAPIARRLEEASDLLRLDLAGLCFKGPRAALNATENTQPAIFALSIGINDVLTGHGLRPSCAAGHSLGELTALTAAGAMDFAAGLAMVRERGALMARACREAAGGMLAIEGVTEDTINEWIEALGGGLWIANLNAPGQIVVSGHAERLDAMTGQYRARANRMTRLAVSGAFHSPLLGAAAEAFAARVDNLALMPPAYPIIANRDARYLTEPDAIRQALRSQMCSPVRWGDAMQHLAGTDGLTFVEVGPGKVLKGLLLRISRGARVMVTETPRDLAGVLRAEQP